MADNVLSKQHSGGPHYPFVDDATFAINEDESRTIPSNVFVDAIVYPPGGTDRQYLSKIIITSGVMTIGIGDLYRELCTGSIDLASGERQIKLTDTYGRPCGLLLGNENIAEFAGALGDGTYTFNAEATEFVASCVVPQPQINVSGIVVNDSDLFAGDVWLVGKGGVVLTADEDTNTVAINLVGDPLFRRRKCLTANAESGGALETYIAPRPLRELQVVLEDYSNATIRMLPDEFGSIFITPGSNQAADNVLRMEQLQNGLRVRALGNVIKQGS